ncbi:MAG: hypothetical protein GY796_21760 [Chloroflexi bacterium]|nr:hypothetical protein [Chloroflexota bacterium]
MYSQNPLLRRLQRHKNMPVIFRAPEEKVQTPLQSNIGGTAVISGIRPVQAVLMSSSPMPSVLPEPDSSQFDAAIAAAATSSTTTTSVAGKAARQTRKAATQPTTRSPRPSTQIQRQTQPESEQSRPADSVASPTLSGDQRLPVEATAPKTPSPPTTLPVQRQTAPETPEDRNWRRLERIMDLHKERQSAEEAAEFTGNEPVAPTPASLASTSVQRQPETQTVSSSTAPPVSNLPEPAQPVAAPESGLQRRAEVGAPNEETPAPESTTAVEAPTLSKAVEPLVSATPPSVQRQPEVGETPATLSAPEPVAADKIIPAPHGTDLPDSQPQVQSETQPQPSPIPASPAEPTPVQRQPAPTTPETPEERNWRRLEKISALHEERRAVEEAGEEIESLAPKSVTVSPSTPPPLQKKRAEVSVTNEEKQAPEPIAASEAPAVSETPLSVQRQPEVGEAAATLSAPEPVAADKTIPAPRGTDLPDPQPQVQAEMQPQLSQTAASPPSVAAAPEPAQRQPAPTPETPEERNWRRLEKISALHHKERQAAEEVAALPTADPETPALSGAEVSGDQRSLAEAAVSPPVPSPTIQRQPDSGSPLPPPPENDEAAVLSSQLAETVISRRPAKLPAPPDKEIPTVPSAAKSSSSLQTFISRRPDVPAAQKKEDSSAAPAQRGVEVAAPPTEPIPEPPAGKITSTPDPAPEPPPPELTAVSYPEDAPLMRAPELPKTPAVPISPELPAVPELAVQAEPGSFVLPESSSAPLVMGPSSARSEETLIMRQPEPLPPSGDSLPELPTAEGTTPLEMAWPVQKVTPPDKPEPRPQPFETMETDLFTPVRTPSSEDTTVQERLAQVPPGMPTDSSVPVMRPRGPRPTQFAADTTTTPPNIQRQEMPEMSMETATSTSDLWSPLSAGDAPPPTQTIQRTAVPETADSAPATEKPAQETVLTEIGELPADLWQLIGDQPPSKTEQAAVAPSAVQPTAQLQPAVTHTFVQREAAPAPVEDSAPLSTDVADNGPTAAEGEEESEAKKEELDVDDLARQVYGQVKRRLAVEWERTRGR